MSNTLPDRLLPGATEVDFSGIETVLARLVRDGRRRRRTPARALTATVVVVGTVAKLTEAAEALENLSDWGGVRAILISEGTETSPRVRVSEYSIAIAGLAPQYVDNAVAALRLSSLPAVVWWRGGSSDALGCLADLADRMVLDTDDPQDVWGRAEGLFEQTAVTDLRWTRLTRWRSLLANIFDVPQVRESVARLRTLTIDARDEPTARLFAGWLVSTLHPSSDWQLAINTVSGGGESPIESIRLSSGDLTMTLHARGGSMEAIVDEPHACSRVVPFSEATLAMCIGEELSVRTRDMAFEGALRASRTLP